MSQTCHRFAVHRVAMLHTPCSRRGMVSTPHHLATQAGLAVLRDGGTAIEAAVAAAAALAVVAPHRAGLGGDGFWLVAEPGKPVLSIDGSGASGGAVDPALYRGHGLAEVPLRGPLAANTVAGAVSGWQLALDLSAQWGGRLPLARLLADAVALARGGVTVTAERAAAEGGRAGDTVTRPALADTLERLAAAGLDDFYRGAVGRGLAAELEAAGAPLLADDLARHRGMRRRPLSLGLAAGTVFAAAPPAQGLTTLMALGVAERLGPAEAGGFRWLHGLAEALKPALAVRDAHLAESGRMRVHAATYLSDPLLDRMAATVDSGRAAPWSGRGRPADGAWIGVVDGSGRAVSCSHGLGAAGGSGLLLAGSGVVWQGRGFSLDGGRADALAPRRKPVQLASPALVRLRDGGVLVWGGSGGDGDSQLQLQLYSRIVGGGAAPQQAVTAPRFLLGAGLVLEPRFDPALAERLAAAGHDVAPALPFDPRLGLAGAVRLRPDGLMEGAADPRGDGAAAGF